MIHSVAETPIHAANMNKMNGSKKRLKTKILVNFTLNIFKVKKTMSHK